MMGLLDHGGGDEVAARDKLPCPRANRTFDQIVRRMLTQESRHHGGIEPMNRTERRRIERQNHNPRRGVVVSQSRDHGVFDSPGRPGFYFQVKNDIVLFREIQYLFKSGYVFPGKRALPTVAEPRTGIEGADLIKRQQMHLAPAVGRALQREIVDGYDSGIPCDLQVGLNEARAKFHGAAKRRHCIFWGVSGSAAMRDRPDTLRSHITSTVGMARLLRHLLPSYQTRPPGLKTFEAY